MTIDVWVPIIGDGTFENPLRPDVPAGVRKTVRNGLPRNMIAGGLAVSMACITIDDADLPRIPKAVPFDAGTSRDKMLVLAWRAQAYRDVNAASFFRTLGLAGKGAQERRDAKDVLLQMVARGLDPQRAEMIRSEHGMPTELDEVERGR